LISEQDYQKFVEDLWFLPPDSGLPEQAYCALAIVGEAAEFVDATFAGEAIDQEAGDLTYYVVKLLSLEMRMLSDLDLVRPQLMHKAPKNLGLTMLKLQLMTRAAAICEKTKKHLRDSPKEELVLVNLVAQLWATFQEILVALNLSFSDILELNVAKLSSRLERKILQGSGDDR
jgi:hypothetical protein